LNREYIRLFVLAWSVCGIVFETLASAVCLRTVDLVNVVLAYETH